MNERIRELARTAGYYLYDLTETHGIKTVETDDTDAWITLEKFAELIVKDCRDMFVVRSPSWNLLNEKLEDIGVDE